MSVCSRSLPSQQPAHCGYGGRSNSEVQKSQLRLNIPVDGFGKREPIVTLSVLVTESAEYQAQQRCFSLWLSKEAGQNSG